MFTARLFKLFSTVLFLAALSCSVSQAREDTVSDSKPVANNAEKLKLAGEACRLGGIDREFRDIADKQLKLVLFAENLSSAVTSKDEKEFRRRERITGALKEVFEKDIDLVSEVKTLVIAAFAKEFSEDELKQMIAFYKTETGRKLVEEAPKMADVIIKRTMIDVAPKLNKAMQAAIKEVVLDKKNSVVQ